MANDENGGSKPVSFRVDETEYDALKALAEVRQQSVSEFLRERCDMPGVLKEANRIRAVFGRG